MALLSLSNLNVLGAGLVVILPGFALSIWTRAADDRVDILDLLAESFGLSISLAALIALWFFFTGIAVTNQVMIAIVLVSGLVAIAGVGRRWMLSGALSSTGEKAHSESRGGRQSSLKSTGQKVYRFGRSFLLPVILVVALLAWRFYQARELSLPAWVDSLHHVLLVRLIMENGGLVETLEPYLPVSLYYHFGFHVFAAAFSFWSNLPPEKAVLVVGQILNAAIALSIYGLGKNVWGDRFVAVLALILAGLVSQMPAYYLTWGRYTLLAGLLLLPLAMAEGFSIARSGRSAGSYVRLALYSAGLVLTHYFAAFLLVVFLLFLCLESLIVDLRNKKPVREFRIIRLFLPASVGLVLTFPWVLRVLGFMQGRLNVDVLFNSDALETLYFAQYPLYLWRLAGPTHNYLLLFFASLGIIVALKRPWLRSLALWALALASLSVPWVLRISHFRPDHFVIVLFIPATLFATGLFATAWRKLDTRLDKSDPRSPSIETTPASAKYHLHNIQSAAGRTSRPVAAISIAGITISIAGVHSSSLIKAILAVMFTGFTLWGILATRSVINPSTILVTQADTNALAWVSENVPEDARFLINVIHWQYGSYRGVDGGWWILPLTGRQTLLPPVMYFMGEREYVSEISAWARKASGLESCSQEFWELVEAAGITHVYLRQGVGSLQPDHLEDCKSLRLVYAREGVNIFEITREITR